MERIGIRELRQHASHYLSRVQGGESLEITDRGRPVARLVPIRGNSWEELIEWGRVTVPTHAGDVADEEPSDYGMDASGRLAAMRDES